MTAQKKQKHKRSFASKIARFFLFAFLFLCGVVLLLSLAVNIYLTNNRLEKIASKYTSLAIPRQLDFKAAHFNIFNGFVFNDIELLPFSETESDSFPLTRAHIDKAVLSYNLRQIFKKRIVIDQIELRNPFVELDIIPSTPDSIVFAQIEEQPDTSANILSLPLSIKLDEFAVKNFAAHINMQEDSLHREINIDRVHIRLDQIKVPKGDFMQHKDEIAGKLLFKLDDSNLTFHERTDSLTHLSASAQIKSHFQLDIAELDSIPINFKMAVQQINLNVPGQLALTPNFPIELDLHVLADILAEKIQLDSLVLAIAEKQWVALDGYAAQQDSALFFNATIQESRIPISQLLSAALDNLPVNLPEFYQHNTNAAISISGSTLSGAFMDSSNNELFAELNFNLDPFGMTLNKGEHILQNLSADAHAAIKMVNLAPDEITASFSARFDSLFATLPDSSTQALGRTEISASTHLNNNLVPTRAALDVNLQNVFGALIDGHFQVNGQNRLDLINGSGNINVQQLETFRLPGSPASTIIDADIDVDLNTFKNIRMDIDVNTDSIQIFQDQQAFSFPPMHFSSLVSAALQADFQRIKIDSLTFALNDFIKGLLSIDTRIHPAPAINGTLANLSIDHAKILELVPKQYLIGFEDIQVDGESILSADFAFSAQDSADMQADFTYKIPRMTMDWPLAQMQVAGIHLNVDGNYSANGVTLGTIINIDSLLATQFRPGYLMNNSCEIYAHSTDFTSFALDSGLIVLPTLKINSYIDAILSNPAIPQMQATVIVEHQSDKSIAVIPNVNIRGQAKLIADIGIDSTRMNLLGTLFTDSLDVLLSNNTRMIGIDTDIHIDQMIDLETLTLLSNQQKAILTQTASLMDYYMHQDYFYQTNLQESTARIDSIRFGEYSIENMRLTGYFGNGMLDLPFITMDMLTGSIGGRFLADARNKTPEQTAIDLSLHFSDINSALLLPPDAKSHTRGKIRANSELHATGFDFQQGADMHGFFYITQIQPRAADNLLRELDPEEKDSGVRWTRFLINRGFKPKIFAFEIRNGYCYPSVSFIQPWYFPVRLSGSAIELARIPIAYFFNQ